MCRAICLPIKTRIRAYLQQLSDRLWWTVVSIFTFVLSWAIWFGFACYREGTGVFEDMQMRGREATELTSELFVQLYDVFWTLCDVIVAWSYLLAPFLADTLVALHFLWESIPETSWELKGGVVAATAFVYLLYKIFQAAKRNISTLKFWLLQLVFFFAFAPALFYAMLYFPIGYLPMVVYLITQVIPTGMSLSHVYAIYVEPRKEISLLRDSEKLIGYWVCWPIIDCVNYMPSSFETESQFITITVIIVCIWLLFCGGSRLFYSFASSLFNFIKPILARIMQCLPVPSLESLSFSQIMKLQNLFTLGMRYKYITIPLLIIAALFTFRAYMFIMDLISWFIWRAAAVDSARVLSLKIRDLYIDKISFWIICQTVLALQTSTIWYLIGWTQPFILMGSMIAGRTMMDFAIKFFPLTQVQKGIRVARESIIAAASPRGSDPIANVKTLNEEIKATNPEGTLVQDANASVKAVDPDKKKAD